VPVCKKKHQITADDAKDEKEGTEEEKGTAPDLD
jgi:hypothetical protein